jgi:NADH dehydrogenase [ubiquinone] 1 alpha subcomplex assembly factor 7
MNDLEQEIRQIIAIDGPIPVSRYMALCLSHPGHGYYMGRDPFGEKGDFITAPEVSQMFGELIGVWLVEVWKRMGSPPRLHLVELGPGRGTLMSDLLRAAKVVPEFRSALEVHLVETSPKLADIQRDLLQVAEVPMHWHTETSTLPTAPLAVIANEFLDALPAEQFIKLGDGWHEWRVGIVDDKLVFGASPILLTTLPKHLPTSVIAEPVGTIFERRDLTPIQDLTRRISERGGVALFIDYGHVKSGAGNTLQAVGGHKFADPLERPGEVDLTVHVDFEALASFGKKWNARIQGPVTQRLFLMRLGIEQRARSLKRGKNAEVSAQIDAAMNRLIGPDPGMGELFKAMAFTHPSLPLLPGFDS